MSFSIIITYPVTWYLSINIPENNKLFLIVLMHSLCLNQPSVWQVGLVGEVNTALIGITNSALSHEFGCSIHLHLWQIMLLKWLVCHALRMVLNDVAHPHNLCTIWDINRAGSDPESVGLASIIAKTSATLPVHPLDFQWTLYCTCSIPEIEGDCNLYFQHLA